jgi:hypothetical protein
VNKKGDLAIPFFEILRASGYFFFAAFFFAPFAAFFAI